MRIDYWLLGEETLFVLENWKRKALARPLTIRIHVGHCIVPSTSCSTILPHRPADLWPHHSLSKRRALGKGIPTDRWGIKTKSADSRGLVAYSPPDA